MKRIILAALVSAPLLASAAGIADKCSTKKTEGQKWSELANGAKVMGEEAQSIAMAAAKATKRVSLKLEEDGCFVYAFVVKDAAENHTAVVVDPGTGKILKQEKVAAVAPKEAPKPAEAGDVAAAAMREKAKAPADRVPPKEVASPKK